MFDVNQDAYKVLRDIVGETTKRPIVWIGSGMNAPAKVPVWKDLRDRLCKTLENKANSIAAEDRPRLLAQHQFASAEPNYWVAFQVLKEALGSATYRETIRASLRGAESAPVPSVCEAIWRLRLRGVLNLNLDRLAMRAHSMVLGDTAVHEFLGKDAGQYLHLFQSPYPFVANLHGTMDNESSWVFTRDELKSLLDNPGYHQFITTCLTATTVLFVGMSADDVAAGGHLERLREKQIDFGTHYWITPRDDAKTDRWAETAGIRVIRYHNADGRHGELTELIDDLLAYIPKDEDVFPITPKVAAATPAVVIPTPSELAGKDPETIREILNIRAAAILNTDAPDKYQRYEEFCREYDKAIYAAWYIQPAATDNILLGYKLIEEVTEGAFGTVYRATNKDGKDVAIKVLHEKIRRKSGMLQSFRRGVASMAILSRASVCGVVPYLQASEIPACVVMDFVEGPSLNDAVKDRLIRDWATVLRVAVDLTGIIRASHLLPQRVLHRDIRPSNIMLRNGYLPDKDEWEVVVLDFDLSWHRDAREPSILNPAAAIGYLAPEQIYRASDNRTRNTLVDSYGMGMTLYYLRTGEEPSFLQHKHGDWQKVLVDHAEKHPCREWKSLPLRYFRLIDFATRDAQAQRWDMTQIQGELGRLRKAIESPELVQSAELLAEEVAMRGFGAPYRWDADRLAARTDFPTGLSVAVAGSETDRRVRIELGWKETGGQKFSRVSKWVPDAFNKVKAILRKARWEDEHSSQGGYELAVRAGMDVQQLRTCLVDAAEGLSQGMEALHFD
jgi:tRNA A-37 threonylcarbamoyl transferase component Bud32